MNNTRYVSNCIDFITLFSLLDYCVETPQDNYHYRLRGKKDLISFFGNSFAALNQVEEYLL